MPNFEKPVDKLLILIYALCVVVCFYLFQQLFVGSPTSDPFPNGGRTRTVTEIDHFPKTTVVVSGSNNSIIFLFGFLGALYIIVNGRQV